ncbi:dihydrolipoamide acetyltransferase family protein [Bacteroidota bacterium]
MATSVILPKQGQSVETCIITEWYKKKGDRVEKGDLLFAYETDKSSFEEEAQTDGILLEIYFEEGEEVAVLTEVAVIGEAGEKIPLKESTAVSVTDAREDGVPSDMSDETGTQEASERMEDQSSGSVVKDFGGKLRISPRARKMAEEKGILVEKILGTGPNSRIIVRDIEALVSQAAPQTYAASEPSAAPASQDRLPVNGDSVDKPLSNIRKLIAGAMHASLQNSAQLTHHLSADARKILSLRSKIKKMQSEGYAYNITLNDMISFALIRALKSHPDANAHFLGEKIRYFRKVHLGVAVDTERGLMVPVLRNADDLSLVGLSEQIGQLADACRSGKIDPDLLQPEAATFTVSNLGNYGVEMFTPVINLPQVGILGVNTIIQRPAQMEDGTFGFVPYMGLSLTYDHRAIDGGPATLFLADIKKEIENFDHDLIKL